jgi:hypothetical protein
VTIRHKILFLAYSRISWLGETPERHFEWIIKSILYILFGAMIAYYFNNKGFDKGYAKGLESKQSDTLKIHKKTSK